MEKLTRSFFTQPSLTVAEQLLGKIIVRRVGKKLIAGKIVETEAYPGPHDRASHAYNGRRTKRTEVEWNEGGFVYIYLVYGMYWQLNITTGRAGYPECVLIRALEIINRNGKLGNPSTSLREYRKFDLTANGPGKLCNYLKLDKSFYGEDVTKSKKLWLESGTRLKPLDAARGKPFDVAQGKRINIDYAGKHYASRHWRFWIQGNQSVSKR